MERLGLDVGSTTVKLVYADETGKPLFKRYERHRSRTRETVRELLGEFYAQFGDVTCPAALTGSAGLGVARDFGLDFTQEVFSARKAVKTLVPDADAVVELGGEDAKILFLTNGEEARMNGACAGGTGAFIDQMAGLLGLTLEELDREALKHTQLYPIASRCGVFAKSDIQPLINQGAKKPDMCASIYRSIVDQTVAGLAQGREIKGKILFLGGPLTFMKGLRESFTETLKLDAEHAVFPENAEYFVAIGAALSAVRDVSVHTLIEKFDSAPPPSAYAGLPPLFKDESELAEFSARHAEADAPRRDVAEYAGKAYLGVDAGSTTTKLALISEDGEILHGVYLSNKGEPLPLLREKLLELYKLAGDKITIAGACVTGYGEDLIKRAFRLDAGIVETTAHYTAARTFAPDVDFILDIGGQDMKCFKLDGGRVTSILLNEACSSGCGSFVEAFAGALGFGAGEFARRGLSARRPVDLGSRCTVFMNSSVKQAQKDGAGVDDISAGLAVSVVKNALYKVIRKTAGEPLGKRVVVQGGTFLNDCVLRALELELGAEVTRPKIAGLMGAYGAALYAKNLNLEKSSILGAKELENFTHVSKRLTCNICQNKCALTQSVFPDGKFISGNRCDRPLGKTAGNLPNAFEFKKELITAEGKKLPGITVGFPLALNMWENVPFWRTIFETLGINVTLSPLSSRELYTKGQAGIPSDTACYPAKLAHGHIEALIEAGADAIFMPCMTYNFDEGAGDNHYNCAVVAYYPELLSANTDSLKRTRFLFPHFAPAFRKTFTKAAAKFFGSEFGCNKASVLNALEAGYTAYAEHRSKIREYGEAAVKRAESENLPIFVLAGRPYHADPEINHGIDRLLNTLGGAVISEDCLPVEPAKTNVLNQWTYHARLYNAARWVSERPDAQLIQLVSFGCGLDAVTTDEVKAILERNGKFYTQIKIDEINNLGAAKIRLRSLTEAMKVG